jgi:hypothetical protein
MHLHSLIQMQKEIRGHSLHYLEKGIVCEDNDTDHQEQRSRKRSSFDHIDLNQSLSLVSAIFEESFSRLEDSPIPREKESMASISGNTFPRGEDTATSVTVYSAVRSYGLRY